MFRQALQFSAPCVLLRGVSPALNKRPFVDADPAERGEAGQEYPVLKFPVDRIICAPLLGEGQVVMLRSGRNEEFNRQYREAREQYLGRLKKTTGGRALRALN